MPGRAASNLRLPLSLVALAALLAGCSHTPPAPPSAPPPAAPLPGLSVFEQAVRLPAVDSSVVRQGDQVSYLVSQPASGGQPEALIARFDVSCTQARGQMMYPTEDGMAYLTPLPRKFGDESQLPDAQLQQLRDSPQLRQVCADHPRPDWRKVDGAPGAQWVLLDAASLHRQGSQTLFWGAYDYPREQADAEGTGYYVQRRERFTVDCQQQRFRRLSAFYIDAEDSMGAGQVSLETKTHAFNEATRDERLLLNQVCAAPASLAKLAPYPGRIKAPVKMPIPPVAAPVAEAVQQVLMPQPARSIRRLGLSFDATVLKRKIANNDKAQWFFSSDPDTGQLVIQKRGLTAAGNIEVSFRGLISLSAALSDAQAQGPKTNVLALTYLKFDGDWENLPVGQTVSYSRAYKPLSNGKPAASDLITLNCAIESEQPASTLNPALQGTAKWVTCKGENERATGVGHYAYLTAYGMFFPMRTVDQVSDWSWRIEAVE
jgi:hypothetical protein